VHVLSEEAWEDEGYEERIRELRPRLVAYLFGLTANHAVAEDLAQEATVILWDKRSEYDPVGNFSAWAFRIAFFCACNYRRKQARRTRFELPSDGTLELIGDSAAWVKDPDQEREALLRCLAKMSEEDRELLLRRYTDGESLEALSKRANTNRNALAQRMFRIKRSLLVCIHKQLPDR